MIDVKVTSLVDLFKMGSKVRMKTPIEERERNPKFD